MTEVVPPDRNVLRRAVRTGVMALAAGSGLLELVVLGGTIALARLLDPRTFGVFAIVQFAMAFFSLFGDVGLVGALVRKKEEPTQRELSTVFWFQLGLALVLVAIVGVASGFLGWAWREVDAEATLLLRVLAIGLLLSSLRVVPSLLMERRLQFARIGSLDVAGTVAFYLAAVALASARAGAWALVGGALCQGIVSLVGAFLLSPWRPSRAFDWAAARPLLRFGILQQSRSVIGFANGAVTPLYAGRVLGLAPVGYVNWAQSTAYFPLNLVNIIARVTYPAYAKLQHDRGAIAEALGRAIQLCAILTFYWVAVVLGMGHRLIEVVFTAKWMPALTLLYVYAGAISIGFLSPLTAPALDAIGKPGIFARLAIGWTVLNWIAVLIATPRWGLNGFGVAYAVHVVVGNAAVIVILGRFLPGTRFLRRIAAPAVAAAVVWALCRWWLAPLATGVPWLVGALAASAVVFLAIVFLLDGRRVREAFSIIPVDKVAPDDGSLRKAA